MFSKRLDKLFNKIHDLGYDGLYITNLTNIRYLTGFTGSAGVLLLLNQNSYFMTDGRYIQQSKEQVKGSKIFIIDSTYFSMIKGEQLFSNLSLNMGYESMHMSVSNYNHLIEYFPKINWQPTEAIVENIASVKDKSEIESLKTAIEITDTVFDKIIPEIKEGVTEKYISARISYLFKMCGAEGDSYESIIAGGPRSALPHARPTDRKFQKGDFIVMDFGALYNGYHADMTRTLLMGPATNKHHEIYNIVFKSQLNGIATAREGIQCSVVDEACRSIIQKAGYGDLFTHSTGHGIGLEVHTLPNIHNKNILKKRCIVPA